NSGWDDEDQLCAMYANILGCQESVGPIEIEQGSIEKISNENSEFLLDANLLPLVIEGNTLKLGFTSPH
ncbi:hypothetical protein V6248_20665, partial [Pseudoalteromonas agarivorans]